MRTNLLFAFLFIYHIGASQPIKGPVAAVQIDWTKATEWKLYTLQGHGAYNYSIDTLKSVENIPLDIDSVKFYLQDAQVLHPDGPIAWMGGNVVTCKLEGKMRKIDISNYGGFLYDEQSKAFYQIPLDKKEAWLSYIQNSYILLVRQR